MSKKIGREEGRSEANSTGNDLIRRISICVGYPFGGYRLHLQLYCYAVYSSFRIVLLSTYATLTKAGVEERVCNSGDRKRSLKWQRYQ